MKEKRYINKLKQQWITIYLIQGLAICIGFTLLIHSLVSYFWVPNMFIDLCSFVIAALLFLWRRPLWQINDAWAVRYLDTQFPILEDSASLLIKESHELSTLAQLQLEKISNVLPQVQLTKGASKKLAIGCSCLLIGIVSTLTFSSLANKTSNSKLTKNHQHIDAKTETVSPQIEDYQIIIQPPAYTQKPKRTQQQFSLKVEIGATVTWEINTNTSLKSLYVIFNDKEKLNLNPNNAKATHWRFSTKITTPGFYQLVIDGNKSDLYQIDVIPDHPVVIKITQPKPQTTIDIGQTPKVELYANLTDDYGIQEAFISATMASGKGESVSFTEKRLSFETAINNQKSLQLKKRIDLKSLGMKPGDELYFFIEAKDNNGQSSRSDMYSVAIVDTAELMSMAGMTSGVSLVPEYFRSQRQIIIDTEKLLSDKANITPDEFKKRSNNLGIDQKLLRLRYGKFLGEENETQIGGDDEHHEGDGHDHEGEKFGDVQALMDKYAHKHDIAEDATFFEPEIKQQLKAVLNEMWKSELNLRTYKAQEALPFEYKALRLLKDLQQKSRAYVAKTTIKTTALKMEKRLTGELDQIVAPSRTAQMEVSDKSKDELKILLSLLSIHQNGKPFNGNEKALLQAGEKEMITAAATRPASFLSALRSLRKLNNKSIPQQKDLENVANAIYRIIGKEIPKPTANNAGSSKKLATIYFNNLKNKN